VARPNLQLQSALAPARETPAFATCDSTTCREQWERAQVWIALHSKWKVQTATDVMIETYNPTQYDPSYGFSVLKAPVGGGRYHIGLALKCGNAFGCSPSVQQVRTAFVHYVITGTDLLAGQRALGGIR
jgi:hypothetical protein